ncbi:restriction endonuclease subunit S [Pseudomonas aeruginosa]|nr:restriction endonuclease subunit S [Pseudomonas aeruginosa]
MSFPAYPGYKDSGVQWIGNVPEHWDVVRLRNIFLIQKRIAGKLGFDVLSITNKGVKVKDIESGDGQLSSDYSKYQLVMKGEFAMNHMDLVTGYVDISAFDGVTSPDYRVFSAAHPELDSPRFMLRLLQNAYHQKLFFPFGQGSAHLGRWRLPAEEFKDFFFPRPSRSEQTQIARFLDHETARIDALIEEQQRLIELLKEKRKAVISHAVTKGLDSTVPMKDSGVEWLGEVPAHWSVHQLKRAIAMIESGTSVNAADYPAETGSLGVLKTSCVYTGAFDWRENKTVDQEDLGRVSCPLIENTLIVSRMNTPDLVGATGLVSEAPEGIFLPDRLWQVYIEQDHFPSFIFYFTKSPEYREQVKVACSGTSSSMQNLGQDDFRSLLFVQPPLLEQIEIASFLDGETRKLDLLIEEAAAGVVLLNERRSALISAAVTGKIDVRGWQPPGQHSSPKI